MNIDFSDPKIIDGKALAKKREESLDSIVKNLEKKPKIVSILIGDDPSSLLYTQMKQKKARELGIEFEFEHFRDDTRYEKIQEFIDKFNHDETVTGLMIQLPLPRKFLRHHTSQDLLDQIDPKKDIDGLTSKSHFQTAAVVAVFNILEEEKVVIKGKNAVVVGTSDLIGKPIAKGLEKKGARVSAVNSTTPNKEEIYKNADILITATGVPNLLTGDMVKDGVVVIDVGVMVIEEPQEEVEGSTEAKVLGDVEFESVYPKVSKITPVPGGVGPMTVVALMENAVKAISKIKG